MIDMFNRCSRLTIAPIIQVHHAIITEHSLVLSLWLLRHGHLLLVFVFVFSVAPSIARLRPGIDHLDLFDASLTHPVIWILVWAVKKTTISHKVNSQVKTLTRYASLEIVSD